MTSEEIHTLDAVGSSGIAFWKQKLGRIFNFDKQDVIHFTKISKQTRCRASEAECPKIYLPKLSAQAQKFGILMEKGFIGRS